jgi:hypothetical protein
MNHMGGENYSLWDEEDGFFYDVLRYPDGSFQKFRVRSLVGLIPLYAVERLKMESIQSLGEFTTSFRWFIDNRKHLTESCCHRIEKNGKQEYELTIVDETQLRRILDRVLDSSEFLSDFGIRSLSKYHQHRPFTFGGAEVRYDPAESENKIKGGNSNWRGPIWFPTTFLIIESLRKLGAGHGDSLQVPLKGDGAETNRNLTEVAREIANRMIRIFARNEHGERPVYGGTRKFQDDPHWRDLILFYEFYHGDNGAGLGASHQTGWSGLVATLIDEWRH